MNKKLALVCLVGSIMSGVLIGCTSTESSIKPIVESAEELASQLENTEFNADIITESAEELASEFEEQ